jgi:HK97 family phage prohead protease
MSTREIHRFTAVEMRAVKEGDTQKIVGYAAVFDSPTDGALSGMMEVIRPGAFTRTLREKRDVVCTFNHDKNKLLGRTANGTLKLTEDRKGLYFECTPPPTQEARDVMALIDRKDVTQCSFVFRVPPETRDKSQRYSFPPGQPGVRELLDIDLFDVGPNTDGAYDDTQVSLRSADDLRAEMEAERSKAAATIPPAGTDPDVAIRIAEMDAAALST